MVRHFKFIIFCAILLLVSKVAVHFDLSWICVNVVFGDDIYVKKVEMDVLKYVFRDL